MFGVLPLWIADRTDRVPLGVVDSRAYTESRVVGRTGFGRISPREGHPEFFNDKKHGQGSFEWENGDKYTGQWKDGKMNGEGKIKIGGKTSKGYWEDGIKIKDL